MDREIDFLKNQILYVNSRITYVSRQKILPLVKRITIKKQWEKSQR